MDFYKKFQLSPFTGYTKDSEQLKENEKLYASSRKKYSIAIVTPDKIYFKAKSITRTKDSYSILIK